ncbi:intradiol ring-cleavage dioxygenase [Maritimibacter sp. UBA3975]|uniref:intradiol ring-cleavage dioxygenase n=1 Tax=Maritimibacter sp. UBA3975 TaxID=1946833 RepID=UPI0025BDD483|nr:intradiol ring-cleavage dioxygenase [Maritimibacter sp. UBA3975]
MTGVGVFPRDLRAQAEGAGLISPNVCMVMPETTAGPFYFDPDLERRDITEDRTGEALDLAIQVVDAECAPVTGARVDVWHCDALGNYSGYARQGSDGANDTSGETFLRGTQMADARGVARFSTIYPGWYRGRATHIHYLIHLDERTVLTSQVFFPDALSNYLYMAVEPYSTRDAARDTSNRQDRIARSVGAGGFAAVREQSKGYEAQIVVGIDAG